MKTKVCTKCGIEKAVSEFNTHKETRDGYYGPCKKCQKEHATKYSHTCYIKITYPVYFKVCSCCGDLTSKDNYSLNSSVRSRVNSYCKKCEKSKSSKYSKITKIKNNFPVYFKACSKCGKLQSIDNYHNNKQSCDGKTATCITCRRLKASKNKKSCRVWIKNKVYMKLCPECGQLKFSSEFNKKNNNVGLDTYCSDCNRIIIQKIHIKKKISEDYGIKITNIPKNIVELKRTIMTAKTELREHNKKENNLTCISG